MGPDEIGAVLMIATAIVMLTVGIIATLLHNR